MFLKRMERRFRFNYNAVNLGGLFSGAYYFNKYVGAQAEVGFHEWGDGSSNGSNIGTHGNDDGFTRPSPAASSSASRRQTSRRSSMAWWAERASMGQIIMPNTLGPRSHGGRRHGL